MKHTFKITLLLIGMFFLAQLIGIGVSNFYLKDTTSSLPEWIEPPKDIEPNVSLISIIIAIAFGVMIMLLLMRYKAELILRIWFFLVVVIALSVALNVFLSQFANSFLLAFIISLPLAILKVFKRNIIVHNLTELLIYPVVASLFIPILNIPTMVILLILISIYDIYAVWHAGFMQKMAQYQIKQVKIFSGFFVPYLGKKERDLIKNSKLKSKKVKVNVAILGGGDIVFPIILAGVVLATFGS